MDEWKKSLVNHLYWSAVSTPNGDGDIIRAKWMLLDNHIHNKHDGHSIEFPSCKHKKLRGRRRGKNGLSHVSDREQVHEHDLILYLM